MQSVMLDGDIKIAIKSSKRYEAYLCGLKKNK